MSHCIFNMSKSTVDGFEGNCYYVGKNPLYATGDYRQRMEGVFIKAKQQ